ncbi:hypothetical protein [Pantoea sp. 18069]|uniref:hypothetical protein n=1 Tax=Pantoea sp. 18069 TaxID=2681415 RepID=UPI0013578614|nr:hypothetical protein [Pantoea sp. 18069]
MTTAQDQQSRAEPATVVVGAMHRVKAGASFPENIQCVNCGAQQDEFSKPCSAFMNEAAAARAGIEGARWNK